ncbi:putative siderochrome-iron transporter protein [Phaeoacremonium minimum UCRPA7]|uniref:Putative siderochrome-iron transporter protein n=1 Tax=Phaeoacremonium minimum (strain UCR-PA7) TaxID=1286976 RepID=R8B963_PHAM7|nr:putative siderochrome-iron transporter protein [Phaeoacremonium minimum UCRPA7]EON95840.1 putative siderochrome-iron transporter protein [Phaeoacremonium minimum UCRPA7]
MEEPPSTADEQRPADPEIAADEPRDEKQMMQEENKVDTGVATIEAAQAIWGKRGRCEIDNSTVYIYNNYSTSSFNALSKLSTLSTASTIIFAIVKPPIAKLSNVIGRGQTYIMTISFYILAYILMASAKSFNTYAAGGVFYSIGQSGTNIMNDIIISDITTARWRGFAIGVSFAPFLVTVWCSAYIVGSVVAEDGIGWRWGIGMLAILMPFCASFIITTLIYYQGRAKKMAIAPRARITLYDFCSQIDLGGVILLSGGLALLLLPMTLAATSPSNWRTPYIDALIAIGGILLILLPFYEAKVAVNPIVPVHYFKNLTIVICLVNIALDSVGFSCTHTYIYSWVNISHNFAVRDATFYVYTNGAVQCFIGIIAGLFMVWTRRYKYLMITGAVVRTIGYGIMLRLRGADNSMGELFAVQAIQGIGSGIMLTTVLVPAQISVPHAQMAQITAFVICVSFVGGSVGACIAGGIYTNTFKPALWHHLGDNASPELVNSLFDSITGMVPEWGTPERVAVSHAFTDVMRYMTYAALGSSIPALFLSWFLPNHKLPDKNNLVEE